MMRARKRRYVDLQRVAFDDGQAARIMSCNFSKGWQAALVTLDCDHMRSLRQKRARQAAGAGADLDDDRIVEWPGGAGDAAREIEIEKEILAERLLGVEAVARDDLAQRGQIVDHAVIRPASLIASIRLVALATPFPAMSKAVPWSGDVRTKGRPSVTFTPRSKAIVLMGISA